MAFISCVRCVPCNTATKANYSPDAHLLELVQELVDAHREKKQRKSAVAMSDVRDDVWLELQAALGLEVKTVGCNLSVTGSVTAFKWDERDEDKRSDYSDWWQALLDPKKVRVAVMNGNAGNYSLTIPLLEGIPFRLSGTTDVAVVDSHSAITTTPVVGTLFVIEIKKPDVVRSLTQRVVASLIRDLLVQEGDAPLDAAAASRATRCRLPFAARPSRSAHGFGKRVALFLVREGRQHEEAVHHGGSVCGTRCCIDASDHLEAVNSCGSLERPTQARPSPRGSSFSHACDDR